MLRKRNQVDEHVLTYTAEQLAYLGIHLGNTLKNSTFHSRWMAIGLSKTHLVYDIWSYSFFLLKFKWTRLGMVALRELTDKGGGWHSTWYVCYHYDYIGSVLKYGVLMGEVACATSWISGVLTNYKYVLLYVYIILVYLKAGFRLNYRHKKRALAYLGICFSRLNLPLLVFFYKLLSMPVAVREGAKAKTVSVGMLDTDTGSGLNIPIVANDSSLIATNFFLYYFSKKIFLNKVVGILNWRKNLRKESVRKSTIILWFYYYFYLINNGLVLNQIEKDHFENIMGYLQKVYLSNVKYERCDVRYMMTGLSDHDRSFSFLSIYENTANDQYNTLQWAVRSEENKVLTKKKDMQVFNVWKDWESEYGLQDYYEVSGEGTTFVY